MAGGTYVSEWFIRRPDQLVFVSKVMGSIHMLGSPELPDYSADRFRNDGKWFAYGGEGGGWHPSKVEECRINFGGDEYGGDTYKGLLVQPLRDITHNSARALESMSDTAWFDVSYGTINIHIFQPLNINDKIVHGSYIINISNMLNHDKYKSQLPIPVIHMMGVGILARLDVVEVGDIVFHELSITSVIVDEPWKYLPYNRIFREGEWSEWYGVGEKS